MNDNNGEVRWVPYLIGDDVRTGELMPLAYASLALFDTPTPSLPHSTPFLSFATTNQLPIPFPFLSGFSRYITLPTD